MDMQIYFPNLGIFLENVGKNFSVFGFEIAFYGCTMATGIIVGYLMAAREANRIRMIIWICCYTQYSLQLLVQDFTM